MAKSLEGMIAVVTGTSRGIGHHAALHLARAGAHIVAVARTQGGLEELDDEIRAAGGTATLVPMDLTDFDAIDRLGASIFTRWKKLDILIGNAGILGKITPLAHLDQKSWDETMKINLTANYRLIRSLDPLLRAAPHARAVFVTSGQAQKSSPFWGSYSISKAALEAMVRTYAHESHTTTVRANCFSPGPTRTRMRASAMPGEDPATLPHPSDVAAQLVQMCSPAFTANGEVWKYAKTGLFKQG